MNTTKWYVVIECKRTFAKSSKLFPYNDYRGIACMTTNKEEALAKEKEIDGKQGSIGIVEIVHVCNA